MLHSSSVDQEEYQKFAAWADDWWNPQGKFKILHKLTPIRLQYIINQIRLCFYSGYSEHDRLSLANLNILDVGCGGGLISEPITRLGGKITAIDMLANNIATAKAHAQQQGLAINYINTTIENLASEQFQHYQVILLLEVIEHVNNPKEFLAHAAKLLAPDGLLIISTINRNLKSLLLAKLGAEYILNWLPRGMHQWQKFIKPSELYSHLTELRLHHLDFTGLTYQIWPPEWQLTEDISVNYFASFKRNK